MNNIIIIVVLRPLLLTSHGLFPILYKSIKNLSNIFWYIKDDEC